MRIISKKVQQTERLPSSLPPISKFPVFLRALRAGKVSNVDFDHDDTLQNARATTLALLNDFGGPAEEFSALEIPYDVRDAAQEFFPDDSAQQEKFVQYWFEHFFGYEQRDPSSAISGVDSLALEAMHFAKKTRVVTARWQEYRQAVEVALRTVGLGELISNLVMKPRGENTFQFKIDQTHQSLLEAQSRGEYAVHVTEDPDVLGAINTALRPKFGNSLILVYVQNAL